MTSEQSKRNAFFRASLFRRRDAVTVYARLALGAAFLSAVAARFGLWDGTVDGGHYRKFIEYTAQVNSFLPGAVIPFLACLATIAETAIGTALIAGIQVRIAALAAAVLLAFLGPRWRSHSAPSLRWITQSSRPQRRLCYWRNMAEKGAPYEA